MTDTAAIQSRHYRVDGSGFAMGLDYCSYCRQPWGEAGCDARVEGDRADRAEQERDALRAALDAAYAERNLAAQLSAALAIDGQWRAGFGVDESEPEWPVLYIDLGSWGQVSWHMPAAERLPTLPMFDGQWDGTDDKPTRIPKFIAALAASPDTGQETEEGRCTFRPAWEQECGKPEADPVHPRSDEKMPVGGHVFRTDSP